MSVKRDILVKDFIDELTILKERPFKIIETNVSEVLFLAYEIGRAKIEFKDDEQRTIASLIKDTIKPIDNVIFKNGCSFEHNQAAYCLVIRSGLQFMLDNFKNFPVSENETLEETFKYLIKTESIETLDESLMNWKNSSRGLTEEDIPCEHEDITRPKDVPDSHIWWYP